MYRLLIVTDAQNVKDMISAMQGWEAMGFKPPRIRCSMEEAVDCIHRHHLDAIAVDENPQLQGFLTYLDEHFPTIPLFQIGEDAQQQQVILHELSGVLSRLRADDTNDEYDENSRMAEQRERWLKKVIGGLVSQNDMARQLRLYRCCEKLSVPCVLARLEMQQDDRFFGERWHYGSERLETALRNFFGTSHDRMLIHVAVVSPQEVRVLCYPAEEPEALTERGVYEYVQETVEQIDHYLGLSMRVADVRSLPGLAAFASDISAL